MPQTRVIGLRKNEIGGIDSGKRMCYTMFNI